MVMAGSSGRRMTVLGQPLLERALAATPTYFRVERTEEKASIRRQSARSSDCLCRDRADPRKPGRPHGSIVREGSRLAVFGRPGFDKTWLRTVRELAAAPLATGRRKSAHQRRATSKNCHREIEAHEEVHLRLSGEWDMPASRDVDEWTTERYPWRPKKNRRRATSQGQ